MALRDFLAIRNASILCNGAPVESGGKLVGSGADLQNDFAGVGVLPVDHRAVWIDRSSRLEDGLDDINREMNFSIGVWRDNDVQMEPAWCCPPVNGDLAIRRVVMPARPLDENGRRRLDSDPGEARFHRLDA